MTESFSLFATTHTEAARAAAVDQIHSATAIYTCEPVVDDLLDRLDWPRGSARLVDPACGDGIFLGRALTKTLGQRTHTDSELLATIEGWEIHPHACHQARARVQALLIAHGRTANISTKLAEQMVRNLDFLTDAPTVPQFDSVAGNPPYLRWLNVPKLLRDGYAAHVPAHAANDLLHSFIDRCARTLRPGGQIGFISADRWLFAASAAALREQIGKNLSIQHMQRLDAKTAFYRPKQRKAGSPPRIHPVLLVLGHGKGQTITREAIYPVADSTRYAGLPALQDVAEVRLGPWLGTAGVFVVTALEAAASGLPADVLVPAVDTDDVRDGVLGDPTRYAIRTRPDVAPCPTVASHIERTMASTGMRGRQAKAWMPPESFHRLHLNRQSLMVPRIAKTPRGIRVPAGVLALDHNAIIACDSQEMLDRVEKALASDLAADWLREHAAPLENGYFAITVPMLRKMPVKLDA